MMECDAAFCLNRSRLFRGCQRHLYVEQSFPTSSKTHPFLSPSLFRTSVQELFSICPHVSSLLVFQLAAKFLHQGDHSQGRPKWPLHASRPELSLLKPARPASIVVKSMHNRLSYDLL